MKLKRSFLKYKVAKATIKSYFTKYDGFSAKVIKAISEFLCEPLSHICNLTFVTDCFPDRLKLAKVIPLYKSENKKMVSNYRPISILSLFSKFFGKAYAFKTMNFLIIISYYMKISTDLCLNIPLTWHY